MCNVFFISTDALHNFSQKLKQMNQHSDLMSGFDNSCFRVKTSANYSVGLMKVNADITRIYCLLLHGMQDS